jgi:hypothetical protein
MIRVWVGNNVYSGEVQGGSGNVEEASGRNAFFLREQESGIFELHDLRMREVGTNLDRPHRRNRRSFLVNKEFVHPPAT